jgi:hypothetical protein
MSARTAARDARRECRSGEIRRMPAGPDAGDFSLLDRRVDDGDPGHRVGVSELGAHSRSRAPGFQPTFHRPGQVKVDSNRTASRRLAATRPTSDTKLEPDIVRQRARPRRRDHRRQRTPSHSAVAPQCVLRRAAIRGTDSTQHAGAPYASATTSVDAASLASSASQGAPPCFDKRSS